MNAIQQNEELDTQESGSPKTRWSKKKVLFLIGIAVLAVAAIALHKATITPAPAVPSAPEANIQNTTAESAQELADIIARTGRHLLIPEGDEPTLATITDAQALASQQSFFRNAVNGDKLLIFPKANQAVIYSPSRDVLVNVGPIQFSEQAATSTPLSLEIRNGGGIDGQASATMELIGEGKGYRVTGTANAARSDYAATLLVSVAVPDEKKDKFEQLARALGATPLPVLPQGEAPTDAEALLIIGKNSKQ